MTRVRTLGAIWIFDFSHVFFFWSFVLDDFGLNLEDALGPGKLSLKYLKVMSGIPPKVVQYLLVLKALT